MRWIIAIAFVVTLSVASAVGFVKNVDAHSGFERSEPAQGQLLPEPPARVDIWFSQEVLKQEGANFVRVFDGDGAQVSDGDGTVDDDDRTHVYSALPPDLPDGRYIVRWKSTSDEDQDTTEGVFCFYVGGEPTEEQLADCMRLGLEAGAEDDDGSSTTTIIVIVVAVVAVLLIGGGGLAMGRGRASA